MDGTFHKEAESMCTIKGLGVSHEKMSTFISLTCKNWILHLPCVPLKKFLTFFDTHTFRTHY